MFNALLTHTPLSYLVQSLWRDEAFSVLAAGHPLSFIVSKLGFEPPVYYTMLHFWIRIFGESEIAARSLSFIGFLGATAIIIEWAPLLYRKHWLSWYLPLFFFLNPMLMYYAFEVRTYGWYTFFATAMIYSYATNRWVWFAASAILGFYTHVYILPFVGILALHRLITTRAQLKRGVLSYLRKPPALAFGTVFLAMIPWLAKIAGEMGRLKSSWYFPVDIQLVYSALGNMFTGYEGTPWYGWRYTGYLSLLIVSFIVLSLRHKHHRDHSILLLVFGGIPLFTVIGISFIKPLFVNRYLIPATIAEVLLIVGGIAAIRNSTMQKVTAATLLLGVVWFNCWYPPQHRKPDFREAFEQINTLVKNDDIIMADNALIYLETLYYAKDRSKVYLYNPTNGAFAWYIGDALITPDRMLKDVPVYPTRAILVHGDTSYEITYRISL